MDLCERRKETAARHPWERARLHALRLLIRMIPRSGPGFNVLDVGCGDGFVSQELHEKEPLHRVTALDTHLTDQEVAVLGMANNGVTFCNRYHDLKRQSYNLLLLLDVLEHLENDRSFLDELVDKYVTAGGYVVITAPAFPFLFGSHDLFLKHHRRYRRQALLELSRFAKLECLSSGYLFFCLLPIRLLSILSGKLASSKAAENKGVGAWKHGRLVSQGVEFLLRADVQLSLLLLRIGVRTPGLTVWTLCRKPRS